MAIGTTSEQMGIDPAKACCVVGTTQPETQVQISWLSAGGWILAASTKLRVTQK